MTLQSLLKPIKFVDEQIERQYAKIRKGIFNKGINLYGITTPMNLMFIPTPAVITGLAGGLIGGLYGGCDFARNIEGLFSNKQDEIADGTIAIKKDTHIMGKVTNSLRLPVFLIGASLTATGICQLVNSYVLSKEPDSGEGIQNLMSGIGWLSQASSIYLKNSDPKLLDKESIWARTNRWAKSKIKSLSPRPFPQPRTTLNTFI
jgi:hypothetical protein